MLRAPDLRRPSDGREAIVLACVLALVALLAALALSTLMRSQDFEDQRRDRLLPAESRPDALLGSMISEPTASAFRSAHDALRAGERFALVVAPGTDRSTEGTHRLFANHYLYPAIVVDDPVRADVLIALFGGGSPSRDGWETVFESGDAWVGRRR